jgi:hypothetical protein
MYRRFLRMDAVTTTLFYTITSLNALPSESRVDDPVLSCGAPPCEGLPNRAAERGS